MNKKLIIFDFDDTLTDNSERDFQSFLNVINEYNFELISREKIFEWRKLGKTSEFVLKQLIKSNDEILFEKCFKQRSSFLKQNSSYIDYVKLKLGTMEILSQLNKNHILILNSIQSNHQDFLDVIEQFEIKKYFQKIFTSKLNKSKNSFSDRYNVKKSLYLEILSEFTNIKNILVIGNLFSDIIPANDLNIETLLIKGSFGFDTSSNVQHTKIIELNEIYDFI